MADHEHGNDKLVAKRHPFFTAPWVWLKELDKSEFKVACAISTFADSESRAWPTINQIAERANVSVATTKRAIKVLQDKGVIKVTQAKSRNNGFFYNVYVIDLTGSNFATNQEGNEPRVQNELCRTDIHLAQNELDRTAQNEFCQSKKWTSEEFSQGLDSAPMAQNELRSTAVHLAQNEPLTRSNDLIKENDHDHDPDLNDRRTRSVKTKATVITTPEELLFASQEINAWIKSAKDRGARNSQIQSSLVMMRTVHLEHCNEQYIKSYFSLAAEKRYYELQRAWVEEFIAKQESRKHQVNDFIPSSSMAVPKVSPRDALVAKYGGQDVYMRLEEDGPIYITALHKADGVTGGLNDDYMVELWIDGKPRYIDYAEVESLMTTKEEYESWNAFLNLF